MSAYTDRMYRKQQTVELRLKDAVSRAKCFESNLDSFLEQTKRIFDSADYKRLPLWRREYLRGVFDTLFHQLQNELVWILTGPDGVRYGPGNDAWLEHDLAYKQAMQGQHVWPKAWEQGKYKPF